MSRRGWLLFFAVGLLWGIPYLMIKVAVEELSAPAIVFSRVVIGSLILIPIAIHRGTFKSAFINLRYVTPYAIAEMVIPWILITAAEQKINSGLAGLLVATVPIWSTILASIYGDKTVWHHKRLLGMLVGFIGIVLVVGIESISSKTSFIAIAMILLASASYAWAVARVQRKIPEVDGIAINGIAMFITAIIYLPFVIANHPKHVPSLKVIASVAGLGLLPTALAFIFFFILMKEIGAARASLVTYLNTAFAVLLGVIALGEPLTLGIAIGLPLVLIGSYFASRKPQTTSL